MKRTLYFATNRRHRGNQWKPTGYGKVFSDHGRENLRFGKVVVNVDSAKVRRHLVHDFGHFGTGDGNALAKLFGAAVKANSATALDARC